jgi:DNA-binding Lrp family transcriptional regulator
LRPSFGRAAVAFDAKKPLERQVRDVLENFEDHVAKLPEVMSGFLMSGGSDYLLRAVVRDLPHYRDFLNSLTIVEGVAHIQSSFALKAFVNKPSLMM